VTFRPARHAIPAQCREGNRANQQRAEIGCLTLNGLVPRSLRACYAALVRVFALKPAATRRRMASARRISRCVPYWSTLKVGAARIDLDGNVAGEVTLEDQQAAKLKIAKAERRAKAREIEDRKKPAAPPVPSQPPGRRR
jgi:hypothetical protein